MYTISTASAAVTGARHLRTGKNGQDAAATWTGDGCAAAVVCDGCSSGAYSEVGARLGAQLAIRLLRDALIDKARPRDIWPVLRAQLVAELAKIADALPGDRERVVHDHLLFTIVAAAYRAPRGEGDDDGEVAVWALGDGGYMLGDRIVELGPFTDNQPPYLGYDLLGAPQPSHLEIATGACERVIVATDGVVEVGLELPVLRDERCFDHPDALRRTLAVLAKGGDKIDWEAHRVVRTPAALQDDGAIAVVRWRR